MTRNQMAANFLQKLQRMVTEEEAVISWKDGAIVISSPVLLADLMLKYFRHNNYTSFQRQLNYFGFKKVAGGRNKDSMAVYVNADLEGQPLEALLTCKKRITRGASGASGAGLTRPNGNMGEGSDGGSVRKRARLHAASAPDVLTLPTSVKEEFLPRAASADASGYYYEGAMDYEHASADGDTSEDMDDAEYCDALPPSASRSLARSGSSYGDASANAAAISAAAAVTAAAAVVTASGNGTLHARSSIFGQFASAQGIGSAGALMPASEAAAEAAAAAIEAANAAAIAADAHVSLNGEDAVRDPSRCFPSDFKDPAAAAEAMESLCTQEEIAAATHGAAALFLPRRPRSSRIAAQQSNAQEKDNFDEGPADLRRQQQQQQQEQQPPLSLNIHRPDGLTTSFSSYCAMPLGGRGLLTPRGLSIRAPGTPRTPIGHRSPTNAQNNAETETDMCYLPAGGGDFLGGEDPPNGQHRWLEASYDGSAAALAMAVGLDRSCERIVAPTPGGLRGGGALESRSALYGLCGAVQQQPSGAY